MSMENLRNAIIFDHKLLLVRILDQQITSRQDVRFYESLRNIAILTQYCVIFSYFNIYP